LIDAALARRLVASQFPQWRELPLTAIAGGWDNRTFRLGDELVLRLPSSAEYVPQVHKEHAWLPHLAPRLPVEIPSPVAMGRPAESYPWPWSVYRWIEGDTPDRVIDMDLCALAVDVARFLDALRAVDANDGPEPGPHNFHRGGALSSYEAETRRALAMLEARIDAHAGMAIWDAAVGTSWQQPPVWVHGDVSPGNLLLRDRRLAAVIDFGSLAVGDPACDLAIAWTFFTREARSAFRENLRLDDATWARGRAWALWKAAIVAAGLSRTNAIEFARPLQTLERLVQDA